MKRFLILFFALLVFGQSHSQSLYRFRYEKPWSVGASGGLTQYFGELYSLWKYEEGVQPEYNFSVNVRRTIGTKTRLRLESSFIQMSGQDPPADPRSHRSPRNLHFRARNIEAALLAEYHWKPVKIDNITRHFLNWYAFAGVGASTNTPKARLDGEWVSLRPLALEEKSYPGIVMVFPMGLGMKYKLNVNTDLFIEGNYRFTLTDYLDDISSFNLKDSYLSLLESYGDYGEGPMPERLRLAVRNPDWLYENGQPDVEKIRNGVYFDRNGDLQHKIRRGSGLDHRFDGYFTLNFGVEIYITDKLWDIWKRKSPAFHRPRRFW
ncbi:hypothetical protein GCM10028791_24430 [Echinicola sediminis]